MTSNEVSPNTDLFCNLCNKKIGSVCMMSPDWSALESFRNQSRYHFETEHKMKKNSDNTYQQTIEKAVRLNRAIESLNLLLLDPNLNLLKTWEEIDYLFKQKNHLQKIRDGDKK